MKLIINEKAFSNKKIYLLKTAVKGIILGSLLVSYSIKSEENQDIILLKQSEEQIALEKQQMELEQFYKEAYDHLNWITPTYGHVTINNKDYDVSSLKETYGELYSFIEPLTDEEITQRFDYLSWYTLIMNANPNYLEHFEFFGGFKNNDDIKFFGSYYLGKYFDILRETNDPLLNEYKNNFVTLDGVNIFVMLPRGIGNNDGYVFMNPNNAVNTSIKDKEFMVRLFSYYYNIYMKSFKYSKLEPEYFFEAEIVSSNNFQKTI